MKISVIVPVYNGEKSIELWWEGIEAQTIDREKFEVIVVDNRSTDSSLKILKKLEQRENKIEVRVTEYKEKASSYGARNLGIKKASGRILVFTDIDCIPEKNWLANIEKRLEGKENLIVGGRIELVVEDRKNIWENFDSTVYLSNEKYVRENKVATANMATTREVFEKMAGFLEVVSGEDHQWSMRAAKGGIDIKYLKEALVYHPTRKTYTETKNKMYRVGFGRGQRSQRYKRGCLVHILRVFYLPRSIVLAMNMKECTIHKKVEFILKMFLLRYHQLLGFIEGGRRS